MYFLLCQHTYTLQQESLVNMANHQQFTKLKPFKIVGKINNLQGDVFFIKLFCQSRYSSIFAKYYCQQFCHYTVGISIQFMIRAVGTGQASQAIAWSVLAVQFLNQAHAWFLDIDLVREVCVCVCVSVCPPPRLVITSGMIWRDMDPI